MIGLQCLTCTRRQDTGTENGQTRCAAYPDGIPWQILDGRIDHRQPYEGDGGLRYAPMPDIDTRDMDVPPITEWRQTLDDAPLI